MMIEQNLHEAYLEFDFTNNNNNNNINNTHKHNEISVA